MHSSINKTLALPVGSSRSTLQWSGEHPGTTRIYRARSSLVYLTLRIRSDLNLDLSRPRFLTSLLYLTLISDLDLNLDLVYCTWSDLDLAVHVKLNTTKAPDFVNLDLVVLPQTRGREALL